MKKKDNVTEFPKFININIGVVIFIIIFIYLLFNVLTYLTKVHISVYEVEQGTIAANNIYKGLVLRDETTYSSEYSGSINYYVKEYSKVGFNDLIYTVDENGSVSERLNEAKHNLASLSSRATNDISDILEDGKDAYIAQPWDIISISSKMIKVSREKETSDLVALNGKRIALEEFDSAIETKKLLDIMFEK